jgi:hypothetical protein
LRPRYRCDRALDQLEQGLLDALARHVARDRGIVRLARNLVDLVDVDDPALSLFHVVVALLQQLLDDVFDVFADVPGFGQGRGIGHDEGHVQQACQGLCQQGLARAGRPDQQDVALGKLDIVLLAEVLEAFVVVVDRHRKNFLGLFLPDHVLIENGPDLVRHRQVGLRAARALIALTLFADDVVAQLDALVADEHRGTGDQLAHLMLALPAERAVE